jgi:hypothetical protein
VAALATPAAAGWAELQAVADSGHTDWVAAQGIAEAAMRCNSPFCWREACVAEMRLRQPSGGEDESWGLFSSSGAWGRFRQAKIKVDRNKSL